MDRVTRPDSGDVLMYNPPDDAGSRVARSRRAVRRVSLRLHREARVNRNELIVAFPDLWVQLQDFARVFLSNELSPEHRARANRAHTSFLKWGDRRFTSSKRVRGVNGRHKCPCLFCNWDRTMLVALDPFVSRHVAHRFPSWVHLFRTMVCERLELRNGAQQESFPPRHSP